MGHGLITWAWLGDAPVDLPADGERLGVPLAPPRLSSIYRARIAALQLVKTEYVSWLDGGDDRLLPTHDEWWRGAVARLEQSGAAIAYAGEFTHNSLSQSGVPFTLARFIKQPLMIHHAAICRTSSLLTLPWPPGCYHWETVAYGWLGQRGFDCSPQAVYNYRPSINAGARLLPDLLRSMLNALCWLQGKPTINFAADLVD